MSYEELAFVNLQLASMLKAGLPLEGALRQLSSSMRRGRLQAEMQALEADLKEGVPLREAVMRRRFPDLYKRMLLVGAQSNDLPGVLTLLADYYGQVNSIASRLKGLMVYPTIVVLASLALSCFLAVLIRALATELPRMLTDVGPDIAIGPGWVLMLWLPVATLTVAATLLLVTASSGSLRRWLRWHMPGFKEAALAQLASALRLMLKSGTTLADSLGLLQSLESQTPAGQDLTRWQRRLGEGHARFSEMAAGSRVVPPLFVWLVSSANEELADGFQRAAELYQARANQRVEILLYAALPASILFLGGLLLTQAYPLMNLFLQFGTLLDQLGA